MAKFGKAKDKEKDKDQEKDPAAALMDTNFGPVDVRTVLSDMGVRPYLASMAAPTLFLTPGESDPAAQNTMVVVQGIQKCLNELGYNLPRNGLMNAATQNAIAGLVGRNWPAVPWMHLYKVCKRAKIWGLKPKRQITWKQTQATAIGEIIGLGALGVPVDASIPYTIPSTAIDCTGAGSLEYCFGKTSQATTAFRTLQSVLGVTVDGKIGPKTATKAVERARELWYARIAKKIPPADANHLAALAAAWDKYPRPFVVAASADRTAAVLKRYRSAGQAAVDKVKSILSTWTTPSSEEPTTVPTVVTAGGGTGLLAIVGIGVLGYLAFAGGKKKGRK